MSAQLREIVDKTGHTANDLNNAGEHVGRGYVLVVVWKLKLQQAKRWCKRHHMYLRPEFRDRQEQ